MADEKFSTLPAEAGTPDLQSIICISAWAAGPVWTSKSYTLSQLKTLVYNGTADNLSGGSGGQVLYQSASGTTSKLANGSSGQVLQSNGGTNAPSWVTPATGGITGSGTNNTIMKWNGTTAAQNSQITDDGTTVGISGINKTNGIGMLATVVNSLTANQTNYSIGGAPFQFISGTSTWTIQGILWNVLGGNTHGMLFYLSNTGSNAITIVNNSGTCTATNRIQMISNANISLVQFQTIVLFYDSGFAGGARWRQIQ